MAKKKCEYKRFSNELCGRELYDDKHCVFHSEDIEGKKKGFNEIFWKEFERQKTEENEFKFNGFIFTNDMDFSSIVFDKSTSFDDVQFKCEEIKFIKTKFTKSVSFHGTHFYGITRFIEAHFFDDANFYFAKFDDHIYFKNVNFTGENVYFDDVNFGDELDFRVTEFRGKITSFKRIKTSVESDFRGVKFNSLFTDFSQATLANAIFGSAEFKGNISFNETKFIGSECIFSGAKFKDCKINTYEIFFNIKGEFDFFDIIKNRGIKRIIAGKYKVKDFRFYLEKNLQHRYPVINRRIKDAWYLNDFKKQNKEAYWIWFVLADCGRTFFRWIFLSLILAFGFACKFIYSYASDPNSFIFKDQPESIITFFYYSVVTFTTLGFGDVVPATESLKVWVMAEVILGYIMLGGLISIFANKLARRS